MLTSLLTRGKQTDKKTKAVQRGHKADGDTEVWEKLAINMMKKKHG